MSTRARSVPKARRKKKSKDAPERYFFGLLTKSLKIKTAEVVGFAREFATLIEAGVPAVPALQLMKEARAGRPFEMVIQGLMDDLNSGRPLADAMGRYPKVFNRFFVRTISTADHGAPITDALRQAAGFLDTADSAIADARKAMIYPMIVLTLGLAVTVLMLTVALPPMIDLFRNLDTTLPLPTRVLIFMSESLTANPLEILVGLAVIVFGATRYLKSKRGHAAWHRLQLRIPVLSSVVIQTDTARISAALSSLVDAGLSLPEALDVATETASNDVIRAALVTTRKRLLAGDGLARPLADTGVFPTTFTQALRVGENTGTLDTNLRRMATFYAKSADDTLKSFVALLEPLSTVAIAMLVGFMALAVIMPMYSVLGTLGD
ncbi:MAG: type II secretion system F family protein [Chloroflexi bacterium]|nr:type II secretion system F family protein [Chloroflexota bacterium]